MTLEETFAQRLRTAIAMAGTTQSRVSRAVGISKSQMCNLCAGKSTPHGFYLVDMCRYLHVSADYLLGLTDDYRRVEYAVHKGKIR